MGAAHLSRSVELMLKDFLLGVQHGSNLALVGEGTSRPGLPPKKSPVFLACGVSVLHDL